MELLKVSLWKYYLWDKFKKIVWQKRTTLFLTKFADDIIRAYQFTLNVKWKNYNNMQIHKKEVKSKQKEIEQLNWYWSLLLKNDMKINQKIN